jgi:hypothetical protein
MATVTLSVNPVAVLPWASRALIWTTGVMGAPAVPCEGCTVNTSRVAAPAVTFSTPLVALVSSFAVAVRV